MCCERHAAPWGAKATITPDAIMTPVRESGSERWSTRRVATKLNAALPRFLYYPSGRQHSTAFALLIEALR